MARRLLTTVVMLGLGLALGFWGFYKVTRIWWGNNKDFSELGLVLFVLGGCMYLYGVKRGMNLNGVWR